MKPLIKICGLSTRPAVDAATDNGASHIGFIFFAKSPRNVSPQQARDLLKSSPAATSVAVTVNAGTDYLDEIVTTMDPDVLQLHGSETPQDIYDIKARYQRPVMKALAIREATDLGKIDEYDAAADMLLLDAKPPKGSDLPGGNGVSFDWSLIAALQSDKPVLLSGGIELNNAKQALDLVSKNNNSIIGLDVSSGVESAPGVKDVAKIRQFLSACNGSHIQD
ncbi:MAG: phosphoribosylanthranilate isomerase [Rhizobiaceae bacterium]